MPWPVRPLVQCWPPRAASSAPSGGVACDSCASAPVKGVATTLTLVANSKMGEMTLSILTAEGHRNWVDSCAEIVAAVGERMVERIRHQCQHSCHQPPLTTYDTATKDLMIDYYQRLNAAAWENSGLYRPIIMVYYPRYIWRTVQCTP